MTQRKSSDSTNRLGVKRGTRLISRSTKTSGNTVITPPKAAVAAPDARKDEVHRRRHPFNDMLKRKSGGVGDLPRDNAPPESSNEVVKISEMLPIGDDASDTRMAHRVADLERALAVAKEDQDSLRGELSRMKQFRQADQDTIEELRQQLAERGLSADSAPAAASINHQRDSKMPEAVRQGGDDNRHQNSELHNRLAQLEEQLVSRDESHQHSLGRPQLIEEAEDLRQRLHAVEKESQERLQQLLALKSSISSLTRVDSQITDSELVDSFSQLANRVREWTVSNLRRSSLKLNNIPKETEDTLSILNLQYKAEIQGADKLALCQAIVSISLMHIFNSPIIFGLPNTGSFATLRSVAERTQHLGTLHREWVRATVQVLEHSEANGEIELEKEASLYRLIGEISHVLFTLTSISLSPNAQSMLAGILKDAVSLQRTLALQKARYDLLFFRCQEARIQFDHRTMEAVNDLDSAAEDDTDMDVDRTFLFCVFPGFIKYGNEWGEHPEMSNVLLKARVCSGVS